MTMTTKSFTTPRISHWVGTANLFHTGSISFMDSISLTVAKFAATRYDVALKKSDLKFRHDRIDNLHKDEPTRVRMRSLFRWRKGKFYRMLIQTSAPFSSPSPLRHTEAQKHSSVTSPSGVTPTECAAWAFLTRLTLPTSLPSKTLSLSGRSSRTARSRRGGSRNKKRSSKTV